MQAPSIVQGESRTRLLLQTTGSAERAQTNWFKPKLPSNDGSSELTVDFFEPRRPPAPLKENDKSACIDTMRRLSGSQLGKASKDRQPSRKLPQRA
jgi:hypothetical protein